MAGDLIGSDACDVTKDLPDEAFNKAVDILGWVVRGVNYQKSVRPKHNCYGFCDFGIFILKLLGHCTSCFIVGLDGFT